MCNRLQARRRAARGFAAKASLVVLLSISTARGASLAAEKAAAAASPATQPADALSNRTLSAEESAAYRAELKMVSEVYTLDSYRESVRQVKQAAQRQASQDMQAADAKAHALAQAAARTTRRNLIRHRRRKGPVIAGYYDRLQTINRDRQQARNAAAGEAMRARQASGGIERDLTTLERAMRNLAATGVHAKYGQMRSASSALAAGLSAMRSAFMVLDATDDTALRHDAGTGLEQAVTAALEEIGGAEPVAVAAILAGNHAGLKGAISAPAGQGFAAEVAEAWRGARDQIALTPAQSLAAEYWIREADKLGDSAGLARGAR